VVRAAAGQTHPDQGFEGCVGSTATGACGEAAQDRRGAGASTADANGPEAGYNAQEEAGVPAIPTAVGTAAHPGAGARDAVASGATEGAVFDGSVGPTVSLHATVGGAATWIAVAPA